MPTRNSYDYAIIRVVPRVEREEFINVGVILFCRTRRYLDARIELDRKRLIALAPDIDPSEIQQHLDLIPLICQGKTGVIREWSLAQRFHWLVAPRSAIIQTSAVHTGLCQEPAVALGRLMESMVSVSPALRNEN
ncbi:MAG: DUF3037 domain-containing protein [Ardenticatenaceae bacterium]